MQLTLGFSPCPNDCFIFDALVHKKIDTQGINFNYVLADVEALNKKAFESELAITKLSYHAFAYLTDKYSLLDSGSALGFNCGPLLISKNEFSLEEFSKQDRSIAIPGKYTTANFLLSIALPQMQNKIPTLFSDIENDVLSEKVDAGLIIHENRFTYEAKGLKKIIDLGEFWESLIQAPIPLGGIVVRNDINKATQQIVESLIRKSVEFAFANPNESKAFVAEHAQEMDEVVKQKHIDLYVNQYSISLGDLGRNAVNLLMNKALELGLIQTINKNFYV